MNDNQKNQSSEVQQYETDENEAKTLVVYFSAPVAECQDQVDGIFSACDFR